MAGFRCRESSLRSESIIRVGLTLSHIRYYKASTSKTLRPAVLDRSTSIHALICQKYEHSKPEATKVKPEVGVISI